MPPLLLQFLASVSRAGLQAGPRTPCNRTRNWLRQQLWAFWGRGGGGDSTAFLRLFNSDPVASNLLYRVKLSGCGGNNSFHRSCSDNQDTWAVNLNAGKTGHHKDAEPARCYAAQRPSPLTDRLTNFTAESSPAPQPGLGFAEFNYPSLPPSLAPVQEQTQRKLATLCPRVSLLSSADTSPREGNEKNN